MPENNLQSLLNPVIGMKLRYLNGGSAFVAKWVVSTNDEDINQQQSKLKNQTRVPGTLKGLTIVIDPGHGGNDRGTTGARGTDEKNITLLTSELLASKLKAAGANVYSPVKLILCLLT